MANPSPDCDNPYAPELSRAPVAGAVVEVANLTKRYGETLALDGISLRVEPGEVIGLLGPNGAGKTTLLEILQGLRSADSGTVQVFGAGIEAGLGQRLDRIGVSPQSVALPGMLSAAEMLGVYGRLYERKRAIPELIEQLGLTQARNTRFSRLSGGQRKRLALGVALLGDPDLLLLDEPTSDIDPQGRRHIWDLVTEVRAGSHRSTVLSTHQMEEAEALCHRVVIIDHGRILANGSPADLVMKHAPGHALRFTTPPVDDEGDLSSIGDAVVEPCPGGVTVQLQVADLNHALESIMAWRARGKLRVDDLQVKRNSLEQVFLNLTGRSLRD
jgi:ABC-2 type transport system ATP-binding protein